MIGRQGRKSGFTLVELLVVIGIIVVLVGILLPVINSVRRNAEKNRIKLDLNAIALALDAYKQDFGDYPRPIRANGATVRVLAWALIGPGPVSADGADGPGFRTSWAMNNGSLVGSRVWGPYLSPEKFKAVAGNPYDLQDSYESVIEYFPRWKPGVVNAAVPLFGVSSAGNGIYDNRQAKDQLAVNYFQHVMGDVNNDDKIGAGETLHDCPDFLLLSLGYRKAFSFTSSTDPVLKTLDVNKASETSNLP